MNNGEIAIKFIPKTLLKIGVDAEKFIEPLEGGWDTVIFDYPYYSGPMPELKPELKHGKYNYNDNLFTLPNEYIENLKSLILKKSPDANFVYFHTDLRELNLDERILIWYKPDADYNGARRNVKKENYWKSQVFKHNSLKGRACIKPYKLYKLLYEEMDSKFILDPFAGFGNSIRAAIDMQLKIQACDIDSSLDWSFANKLSYHSL